METAVHEPMDILNTIVLRLDKPGQMDDEIKGNGRTPCTGYGVKTLITSR